MTLYHKVRAVERVFHQLEKDVATFQQATALKCLSSCGRCCQKPDISASVLEFLPLAYHLHKQNQAFSWYERLLEDDDNGLCPLFSPFLPEGAKGFCGLYQDRGLICRLFGFSAMLNKHGDPQLVTCKPIKESFPEAVARANAHIEQQLPTPIMRNYYFQLRSIDSSLGEKLLPIKQAILEALKLVMAHYAYRRKRA